jgi:hypothetical protein
MSDNVRVTNAPQQICPVAGGYTAGTVATAAIALAGTGGIVTALKDSTRYVRVRPEGGKLRYRVDGIAPDSTHGDYWPDGEANLLSKAEALALQLIRDSGTGSDVTLHVQEYTL